jgi:hypothetical protein
VKGEMSMGCVCIDKGIKIETCIERGDVDGFMHKLGN